MNENEYNVGKQLALYLAHETSIISENSRIKSQ